MTNIVDDSSCFKTLICPFSFQNGYSHDHPWFMFAGDIFRDPRIHGAREPREYVDDTIYTNETFHELTLLYPEFTGEEYYEFFPTEIIVKGVDEVLSFGSDYNSENKVDIPVVDRFVAKYQGEIYMDKHDRTGKPVFRFRNVAKKATVVNDSLLTEGETVQLHDYMVIKFDNLQYLKEIGLDYVDFKCKIKISKAPNCGQYKVVVQSDPAVTYTYEVAEFCVARKKKQRAKAEAAAAGKTDADQGECNAGVVPRSSRGDANADSAVYQPPVPGYQPPVPIRQTDEEEDE